MESPRKVPCFPDRALQCFIAAWGFTTFHADVAEKASSLRRRRTFSRRLCQTEEMLQRLLLLTPPLLAFNLCVAFAPQRPLSFRTGLTKLAPYNSYRNWYIDEEEELTESTLQWSPSDAKEFVLANDGYTPTSVIGKQLKPMVSHWSGIEVGNFLTKLFGESLEEPRWDAIKDVELGDLAVLFQVAYLKLRSLPPRFASAHITFLRPLSPFVHSVISM